MPVNAEGVWLALSRLHANVGNELERAVLTSSGLSLAAYDVLTALTSPPASDSPLTMTEVADRVALSRTRVSRLVDELIRDGLAQRRRNPDDGRSAFVEPTDEGVRRHAAATPAYRAALNSGLKAALSPDEFMQLAETLDRMSRRN